METILSENSLITQLLEMSKSLNNWKGDLEKEKTLKILVLQSKLELAETAINIREERIENLEEAQKTMESKLSNLRKKERALTRLKSRINAFPIKREAESRIVESFTTELCSINDSSEQILECLSREIKSRERGAERLENARKRLKEAKIRKEEVIEKKTAFEQTALGISKQTQRLSRILQKPFVGEISNESFAGIGEAPELLFSLYFNLNTYVSKSNTNVKIGWLQGFQSFCMTILEAEIIFLFDERFGMITVNDPERLLESMSEEDGLSKYRGILENFRPAYLFIQELAGSPRHLVSSINQQTRPGKSLGIPRVFFLELERAIKNKKELDASLESLSKYDKVEILSGPSPGPKWIIRLDGRMCKVEFGVFSNMIGKGGVPFKVEMKDKTIEKGTKIASTKGVVYFGSEHKKRLQKMCFVRGTEFLEVDCLINWKEGQNLEKLLFWKKVLKVMIRGGELGEVVESIQAEI